MKISFLHTLASNQALFAPYAESLVASCRPVVPMVIKHHVHEQLLIDARQADSCPTKLDQVSRSVHDALKEIVQHDQPDMVLCTCSTIGGMAESFVAVGSSTSGGCRVLRVDRPMAEQALQYSNIVVLAALESTIQPTLDLLLQSTATTAKASSNNPTNNHNDTTTCVVPNVWDCFQKGDLQGYAQTIAEYILETYSNHNNEESTTVIVLAQASMSTAKDLVEQRMKQQETSSQTAAVPRILTSPDTCIQYLADEILSRTRKE